MATDPDYAGLRHVLHMLVLLSSSTCDILRPRLCKDLSENGGEEAPSELWPADQSQAGKRVEDGKLRCGNMVRLC